MVIVFLLGELHKLGDAQLRFFQGRVGKEHGAPDDLPAEDEMGFAFDLFLQVAQDDAVFLFHGGVLGVSVSCAYLFVDVEAGGAEDGALSGLSPYEFPGFLRVLHLHKDYYGGVGHNLLRAFFVRF